MKRIQVYDFVEVYDGETVDERICVIGKDEKGQVRFVEVAHVPNEIYIAIGDDYTYRDAVEAVAELGQHLVENPHYCKVDNCPCKRKWKSADRIPQGSATRSFEKSYEPCKEARKRIENPITGFDFAQRRGFSGFERDTRPFLRITFSHAFYASEIQKWAYFRTFGNISEAKRGVYDVLYKPVDSFIARRNCASFDWFCYPDDGLDKQTDIVEFNDFLPCDEANTPPMESVKPPLAIYFDIETIAKSYKNSESKRAEYPVGLVRTELSTGEKVSFLLAGGPNPHVPGATLFDDEKTLLSALHSYIVGIDPDIILGFNSNKFDLPYLMRRAERLGVYEFKKLSRLPQYDCSFCEQESSSNQNGTMSKTFWKIPGRIPLDLYDSVRKSIKLDGYKLNQVADFFKLGGKGAVADEDILDEIGKPQTRKWFKDICKRDPELKEMFWEQVGPLEKLTDDELRKRISEDKLLMEKIAGHFHMDEKDDVGYDDIFPFFHGTAEERLKLVKYCARDVDLCVKIERKTGAIRRLMAKCKVLRLRAKDAMERGLSYLLSMMVRVKLEQNGYVNRPPITVSDPITGQRRFVIDPALAEVDGYMDLWDLKEANEKYPGAFVFEPKLGLHREIVITFDFNSLYPNIMQTFNICRSTQLPCEGTHPDENLSPTKSAFCSSNTREGIYPMIERELVEARKKVREKMAAAMDPDVKDMYDSEQTEIKIAANSLYGLLGTITSELSELSGASSITSWGGKYIRLVCAGLEAKFCPNAKYDTPEEEALFGALKALGVTVIYGDTDSLFIKLNGIYDPVEGERLGLAMQKWVNEQSGILHGTLKMGFEDISSCTLLLAKKKYAKYVEKVLEKPKNPPYLKKAGLDTRALNRYTAKTVHEILDKAMIHKAPQEELKGIIRDRMRALYLGMIPDIRVLKHSSNLSKPLVEYDQETYHTIAAKQMLMMNMTVEPGDRIEYYLCELRFPEGVQNYNYSVSAHLVTGFELKWMAYAEDMHKALQNMIAPLLDCSVECLTHPTNFKHVECKAKPAPLTSIADNLLTRTVQVIQPGGGPPKVFSERLQECRESVMKRHQMAEDEIEKEVEATYTKAFIQQTLTATQPRPVLNKKKKTLTKKEKVKKDRESHRSLSTWIKPIL